MDEKKAIFLCGTPFHIITSVFLKNQYNMKSDMIIYDEFPQTDILKKNLCEYAGFDNVEIMSHEKDFGMPRNKILIYLFTFLGYFRIKKYVSSVLPQITAYSDVFFANAQSVDIVDRFIFCYLKKYHPSIKLHYMEEGWECYDEKFYELTKLDYIFRKYIVRGNTHFFGMTIHSYSLDLYDSINPNKKMEVLQIEKNNQSVTEILKKVFSYIQIEDLSSYDSIVFDTVRKEEFVNDGSEKYNAVVNEVLKDKDNNSVIVKPHPRDKNKHFDYKYFKTYGFPFEILCLYCDFNNYTFINNFSSAVFTPKLLFDQEPTIVFSYKLLEENMNHVEGDKSLIIENFRNLYRDSSKIVVLEK